jgi:hypothetical protein
MLRSIPMLACIALTFALAAGDARAAEPNAQADPNEGATAKTAEQALKDAGLWKHVRLLVTFEPPGADETQTRAGAANEHPPAAGEAAAPPFQAIQPNRPIADEIRFERPSRAAMPDGSLVAKGSPRFIDGRTGKALLIEPATRNFISWGELRLSDAPALDRNPAAPYFEEVFATASDQVPAKTKLVGSVEVQGSGKVQVRLHDAAHETATDYRTVELTDEWRRVATDSLRLTAAGDDVRLEIRPVGEETSFDVARPQIEPGTAATSWIPGQFQRADERVIVSLREDALPLDEGTLLMWARPYMEKSIRVQSADPNSQARIVVGADDDTQPQLVWFIRVPGVYSIQDWENYRGSPWRMLNMAWSPDATVSLHPNLSITFRQAEATRRLTANELTLEPVGAVVDEFVILDTSLTPEQLQALARDMDPRGAAGKSTSGAVTQSASGEGAPPAATPRKNAENRADPSEKAGK